MGFQSDSNLERLVQGLRFPFANSQLLSPVVECREKRLHCQVFNHFWLTPGIGQS
jgi:hypothetical protein